MKKLWLALGLILCLGLVPVQAQQSVNVPATMASVAITISTATTTRLVTGATGKTIYITSLIVVAGGTGNIQFVSGTGATCGTGQTNVTGNIALTAQTGFTIGTGNGVVLVLVQGDSLCAVTSQAVGMPGSLSYAIF